MDIDDSGPPHSMTYAEREMLKTFATEGKELAPMLLAVSHWMREDMDVSFSGYISNWADANQHLDVELIRAKWPLIGPRFISDNSSIWGSALPSG